MLNQSLFPYHKCISIKIIINTLRKLRGRHVGTAQTKVHIQFLDNFSIWLQDKLVRVTCVWQLWFC